MNKRIYFLILLLSCRSMTSNAQTNVGGFISANTTWNLAGSPYIVIGNVLVSHGFTLTVDPGVTVKFNTDKAIQIDGELIAIGTAQSRITFTSNQVNPAPGDWAKIHFPDTCIDAVFDTLGNYLSGSIMKYSDILYAGGLGFGAIHNESSSPYFSHCRIMNSLNCGIYSDGYASKIDSSLIKNCMNYGIYFYAYPTELSIIADTIENNNGGIYTLGGMNNYPKRILNNHIILNYGQVALNIWQSVSNLEIKGNYFIGNTTDKVFNFYSTGGNSMIIDCNHFLNNQTSASIFFSHDPIIGSISNNIFDGNTSSNGAILDVLSFNSTSPLIINNNIIRNNISSVSCFTFTLNPGLVLQFNSIENNTASNAVYLECLTNGNGFKYNNLVNPNCQFELYNNTPYGMANIIADSNYWGSTNTQHVDSAIYDYFDFANQSVVYYSPILSAPIPTDTTCPVISTGIYDIQLSHLNLIVYPNPASSNFIIDFGNILNKGLIEFYNTLGKKLFEENIFNETQKEINLKNISGGIYFLKVFDGEKRYCKKLIVEHD